MTSYSENNEIVGGKRVEKNDVAAKARHMAAVWRIARGAATSTCLQRAKQA